ncbi:MAG: DNA-3-methyladenine glycosylase I [Anaerolineae bacterium]
MTDSPTPLTRCAWVTDDPLYIAYHDEEWGVPAYDDHRLFEMLLLEGAEAGLSWITVLRKREGYRAAFDNFDAEKIAAYDAAKIEALVQDARIIRHRLKINAFVTNAQAYLKLRDEIGSFSDYLWGFVQGQPIINHWPTLADAPTETDESRAMSKDLKKRGFKFVGATICYAFMQACGMVNDHTTNCFRYGA